MSRFVRIRSVSRCPPRHRQGGRRPVCIDRGDLNLPDRPPEVRRCRGERRRFLLSSEPKGTVNNMRPLPIEPPAVSTKCDRCKNLIIECYLSETATKSSGREGASCDISRRFLGTHESPKDFVKEFMPITWALTAATELCDLVRV